MKMYYTCVCRPLDHYQKIILKNEAGEIRKLVPKDAADYRNIRLMALKNHPEAFSSSYEEEKERSPKVYEGRFASIFSFTFGAFVNEKLVGVVTLVMEQKNKIKHRADIVAMYVLPEQRGMGVGG